MTHAHIRNNGLEEQVGGAFQRSPHHPPGGQNNLNLPKAHVSSSPSRKVATRIEWAEPSSGATPI